MEGYDDRDDRVEDRTAGENRQSTLKARVGVFEVARLASTRRRDMMLARPRLDFEAFACLGGVFRCVAGWARL